MSGRQVAGDIRDKVVLLPGSATEDVPETLCLHKVIIVDVLEELMDGMARPGLMRDDGLDSLVRQLPVGAGIVGVGTIVAVDDHGTIALEGVECLERRIDRDLLIVDAKAVTMSVRVREQSGLQHRIDGRLNAGNQVRGREGELLNLGKIVFGVLVESELAKGPQGHVLLRPNLGQVKNVPSEFLSFLRSENLDIDCPTGKVSLLNSLKEVLSVPVWVLGRHLGGLFAGERLDALIGLEVNLRVHKRSIRLGPLVSVTRVSVHVPVGVGGASVGEESHYLMDRLLVGGEIIPEHGGIFQIRLGVPLLSVDEEWKLGRITDEEDGGIVIHPVPVAFFCVELDGEAARVTGSVGRTLLAADSREARNAVGFLSDGIKHVDGGEVCDVMSDFKDAVCPSPLCMDDTFGNTLAYRSSVSFLASLAKGT